MKFHWSSFILLLSKYMLMSSISFDICIHLCIMVQIKYIWGLHRCWWRDVLVTTMVLTILVTNMISIIGNIHYRLTLVMGHNHGNPVTNIPNSSPTLSHQYCCHPFWAFQAGFLDGRTKYHEHLLNDQKLMAYHWIKNIWSNPGDYDSASCHLHALRQ